MLHATTLFGFFIKIDLKMKGTVERNNNSEMQKECIR